MSDKSAKNSSRNMTPAIREMMARIKDLRIGKTKVTPFSGHETAQKDFVKTFCDSDEFGQTAYGEWERGRSAPPIYAVINFAAKYNLSLDYLMRDLGTPQPPHIFQPPDGQVETRPVAKAKPQKPRKQQSG